MITKEEFSRIKVNDYGIFSDEVSSGYRQARFRVTRVNNGLEISVITDSGVRGSISMRYIQYMIRDKKRKRYR